MFRLTQGSGDRPNPQEGSGCGALPYLTYNATGIHRGLFQPGLHHHLEGPILRIIHAVTKPIKG